MPYKNPADQRAAARRHYTENRQAYIDRATQWTKARRLQLRVLVDTAKNVPCADCGNSYPSYVMDLDHVRGSKVCNVSLMVQQPATVEALMAEIAKCDVVCANCHRERTHGRNVLPLRGGVEQSGSSQAS